MIREACAFLSGATCVAGISLSVINAWLTCISLCVSIIAGTVTLWPHIRRYVSRMLSHDDS